METSYGTYHLAQNPSEYQPMRANNFRCIVQGLDNLLRADGDATNSNDYITNAQEVIDFSVVSFDAPHFTQGEVFIKRGNSTVYYAGTPEFKSGNLVINDYAGADGKSILEAWQALSYDVVNDVVGSSADYKKELIILEYLPDNTLVRYWEVKGAWVIGISETNFNAESSEKKQVTATIRYDRAIPHRPEELR